jgi:glycosyltransferase involved in cell wall biosynthesis
MRVTELPHTSQPQTRGGVCVVIATDEGEEDVRRCLESVREHSPAEVAVLSVAARSPALNAALAQLAPADVVVLDGACGVSGGWLERLRDAARGDTNTASASALADFGGSLGLCERAEPRPTFTQLTGRVAERTLRLRPRLTRAVGPCVYLRREALELVGALDEELDLPCALLDLSQRCLLSGLAHVAADDVVVERFAATGEGKDARAPAALIERYPYLAEAAVGESSALAGALQALRPPPSRPWVTLDARALAGEVTGTQVHILELILALARTEALRLRLLIRPQRIDPRTLALLRGLTDTELIAEDEIDASMPVSAVFHRPQQTFAAEDVAIAVRLGERLVLSQLDLIAYRNPGYFPDAGAWEDYRRASRHGLSAAERVVVFSEHTRRELIGDELVEDERIRVVPPGLDHRPPSPAQAPEALAGDDERLLDDGFLLCLGTDFRHKNRLFALRLLATLRDEHGWGGSLVLAGTHVEHGSSRELEASFLSSRPDLRGSVIELGPLTEPEKAWLMARAGAVVYPSAYEGFGLVPFEAALNGVPCLFAAQSSLAEAAPEGTATILQWDAKQSAQLAHVLLTDAEKRASHVAALAGAARELTWDRAAAAMVEIYREAACAPVREAARISRDAVAREARLTAAHEIVIDRLITERRHAQGMYDELNAEVGSGLSLIGPHGTLPDSVQRALLALSARPGLSRIVLGSLGSAFLAARRLGRVVRGGAREEP